LESRKPDVGEKFPSAVPQTSDEFDAPRLGLQWQWRANHKDDWYSLSASKGRLRLFAQAVSENDLSKAPAVLQQKFPARTFAVETWMEFMSDQIGAEAGLTVTGCDNAALAVRRTSQGHQFVWRKNGGEKILGNAPAKPVKLRVEVGDGGLCVFSYSSGEDFISVPETFQACKAAWIGAKIGLYCLSVGNEHPTSHADFDYFRFSPVGQQAGSSRQR
jgi:beta-xylosidase